MKCPPLLSPPPPLPLCASMVEIPQWTTNSISLVRKKDGRKIEKKKWDILFEKEKRDILFEEKKEQKTKHNYIDNE
jgi:hypothetical protein